MLKSFITSKMPWIFVIHAFILNCFFIPVMNNRLLAPRKMIDIFGPFRFHPRFLFRDYSKWGQGHNSGFVSFINACKGKKCLIDVGGHIGLTAMPASRMLATEGKLYVFEPAGVNCAYLSRNIELNEMTNTEVLNMFVGAECKNNVEFFESDYDSGLNSIIIRKNKKEFHKVLKRQVSLDSFCAERGIFPDIIKIDVEGAEFEVLNGAHEVMKTSKPIIYFSLHPGNLELLGRNPEEIHEILGRVGYKMSHIEGTERDGLYEYILSPS